jgi:hypothetical protein
MHPPQQSSEVIFAKSYRGEVMITLIWYAPHNAFYVTLTPSSGEEQTLVDTLFPQVRTFFHSLDTLRGAACTHKLTQRTSLTPPPIPLKDLRQEAWYHPSCVRHLPPPLQPSPGHRLPTQRQGQGG